MTIHRILWPLAGILLTALIVLSIRRYGNPLVRLKILMTAGRKALANLVTPFSVIAGELRRMNDLKEQEMGERLNPKTGEKDPIYIIKELPRPDDTTVFWGRDEQPTGVEGMRRKLSNIWSDQEDDEG